MSEPSQLYARVRLSRDRLDEFLVAEFPDPSGDPDVLKWLATASYHGARYTPNLIRERLPEQTTVAEWVEWLTEHAPYGIAMPSRNEYDETTQTWTLAALDFSENYDDYIAAVAVFRKIAAYKDLPGEDDMLIFGYLYEDNAVAAALRIDVGDSRFLDAGQTEPLVAEAGAVMEELIAEGASGVAEDGL